ncbi:MAG: hypothetical protein R3E95_08275 [Thiolinea sp.]
MNRNIKVACSLSLLIFTSLSHAGDFNYSYLEAGLNHYDNDGIDKSMAFKGAIAVNENIHAFAGVNRTTLKGYGDKISQYKLGLGMHSSISDSTDLVIEGSATRFDNNHSYSSDTGFDISAGIRKKLNNRLEGNLSAHYTSLPSLDLSEAGMNMGGRFYFNENISAGLQYHISDSDSNFLSSSLRLGFL